MDQSPPTDSIDLWYTRVDRANSAQLLDQYRQWLSDEEVARGNRFVFEPVRQQYWVTRGLVRWVLSSYCGLEPRDWEFEVGAHGKPAVREPAEHRFNFNLSHTEGLIICGVCARDTLGVDVEYLGRQKSFRDLARRYFARGEADWYERSLASPSPDAFFRIWTLKESYIKAVGKGLSIPLDSFELIPPDRGQPRLRNTQTQTIESHWQFGQLRLGADYQIAVATDRRPEPLRLLVRETVPGLEIGEQREIDFSDLDKGPVHQLPFLS